VPAGIAECFVLLVSAKTTRAAEPGAPAGRLVTVADVKAAIAGMLARVRDRREMRAAHEWPADLNTPTEEPPRG